MAKKKPKFTPKLELPKTYWMPQEGPQLVAFLSPADITFFGGTRGGGKSDCLIGRHIRGVERFGNYWNGLVIRRKFKDFVELRRRWDELILAGLPAIRIGGDQQTNYIRWKQFPNAQIVMTAVQRAEMLDTFQSMQYTEISIDEAPNIPFIDRAIDKLKGSLRSPHGVPCTMFLTGNPGGPGSTIIKHQFIKPDPMGTAMIQTDNAGFTSCFVKSTLEDNKILDLKDPNYRKRLEAIKNKALREAWLEGNWDVFIGQAFDFYNDYVENGGHLIRPMPLPEYVPVYMSYDWGYGAPFSIGWWWVDSDNRLYRFAEWYGWNGTPNQGLRLTDSEVAREIIRKEKSIGIHDRVKKRYAPPDCFTKKPTYTQGGQGPSTNEEFIKVSKKLALTKIFPDRATKIKQFRERLLPLKNDMPMLVVYDSCVRFREIIPSLCLDEDNIEDLDGDQEDHVYDEGALMCLARPMGVSDSEVAETIAKQEKEAVMNKLDNVSRAAWEEVSKIQEDAEEDFKRENEYLEAFMDLYSDGRE